MEKLVRCPFTTWKYCFLYNGAIDAVIYVKDNVHSKCRQLAISEMGKLILRYVNV